MVILDGSKQIFLLTSFGHTINAKQITYTVSLLIKLDKSLYIIYIHIQTIYNLLLECTFKN